MPFEYGFYELFLIFMVLVNKYVGIASQHY